MKPIAELQEFAQKILQEYLDGKLPVLAVAEQLATALEVDSANAVLEPLVQDGRVSREEAAKILDVIHKKHAAENQIAAASGVCVGGAAVISAVSFSGSVAGLSAAGISSGLAALGAVIGGGMAAGLLVVTGGGFVVGAGGFWAVKKLVRKGKSLLSDRDN